MTTPQQVANGQTFPEVPINENNDSLGQAFVWAHDKPEDSGLVVGLAGGWFNGNAVADSTVSCTDDATNYVVVNRTTRVESVSTSTTNWNDTGTYGRVARITFASGVLTAFHDERWSLGGVFNHSAAAGAVEASNVSVADAGGYFGSPNSSVEAALQILGAAVALLEGSTDVDTDVVYTSDTGSTADSDPGNGLFKWNNATQASATALYVDNQTTLGVSLTTFFASLPPDGYIHVTQEDDAARWQLWKWSGLPTAGSGYYKFTGLTLMATSGTAIQDDKACAISFKGTAPSSNPFDVQAFYPGVPGSSAKVLRIPVGRAVSFAANFSGSYAKAGTASTGTAAFDVQKNGSSIGTITFTASATATFATSGGSAQSLAAGDVLSIIAPGSADATLADIGFCLVGTR